MNIRRLRLSHFRGSGDLSLDLHEKLNVFVGVNGSGKSTILDAAAILLSCLLEHISSELATGALIRNDDISNDQGSAALEILVVHNGNEYTWGIHSNRDTLDNRQDLADMHSLAALAQSLRKLIQTPDKQVNVPLLVYYPVNRSVVEVPLKAYKPKPLQLLDAYAEALSSGANFHSFFDWYHQREEQEWTRLHSASSDNAGDRPEATSDPQLAAVRSALSQLMPGFGNLTLYQNPKRLEVMKYGKPIKVTQLSDGEQCLMALAGDLARRLSIANPARENPLHGEGIVLIDEIDLHLHPRWQHMVVPGLREVFPNCQFLITTHSPHVITHVKPESMFLLTETETGILVDKPLESYGKNVDRILEDLMGLESTRPSQVSVALARLYDLIDLGALEEAQQALEMLRNLIGDDGDLLKAEILIRRKELLGK